MKRFGTWLSTSKPAHLGSSKSLTAIDEPAALQDAMLSASKIMNDEVEQAETELGNGTSPFHKLGHATCMFLRATIGFEKDVMEQTSARLAEAEEAAGEHQKRAIRDPTSAHQSKIYPAGAEYALCHAETQIMGAVVGVLNESLTESLRGFYKLRQAFATLQKIIAAEEAYIKKHAVNTSRSSLGSTVENGQRSGENSSGVMTPVDDSDEEFQEAKEELPDQPTPSTYQGHLDFPHMSKLELQDTVKQNGTTSTGPPPNSLPTTNGISDRDEIDFASLTSDPIDLFIHSGTALCFGTMQLLLSMVPPAFGKLLSILSFRGDRQNGFRLLWRATAAKHNINGALAGLIVLAFHNAAIGLCDVHSKEAYPKARLAQLLKDMRVLYPKSIMWILEEGRMASLDRQLETAYEIMDKSGAKSSLRQMNALRVFEVGMNLMFTHRYQECADKFLACIELNSWSHGMYYYIAGSCHVELYRTCRDTDPKLAAKHKESADELLLKATNHTGKRRLMARQLPLDVYINRKIMKWTARSKVRNCGLAEAVGVSPIEEMIYFWAGFKRMGSKHLEKSLERLAWSESNPQWQDEPIDEHAMLSLLRATCLRCLGKTEEARTILTEGVLCHDWHQLKTCEHSDSWSLPVAHYENAICHWQEAGGEDGDREKLKKCSEEIAKVEKWESFELEARIGMKIKTARVTLEGCGITAQ